LKVKEDNIEKKKQQDLQRAEREKEETKKREQVEQERIEKERSDRKRIEEEEMKADEERRKKQLDETTFTSKSDVKFSKPTGGGRGPKRLTTATPNSPTPVDS